tara:strand:+ start:71 stop:667 length:597 start_codon:yes stop_codon:yes gene_type:complete
MESNCYSEILKLVIKGQTTSAIVNTTGASRRLVYNIRKQYNSLQYARGRMNELEESIHLGKKNNEILNETSYTQEEILIARRKLGVKSPQECYEGNAEEVEKLVMENLSNADIRKQITCSHYSISKARERLQKPSPNKYDRCKFDYKEHNPEEPRLAPDQSLDDMITYGFTVDEISSEFNYGRDVVLRRYIKLSIENN